MDSLKKSERLDKILANSGFGPRKEARRLIHSGSVEVNGSIVREPEFHVDAESDKILVEGTLLSAEVNAYFMMNKAFGAVCSSRSDRRKTVFDYLSPQDNRKYLGGTLSTVGRLDADTEGLLIITSDGALIHRITSPRHEVPKTYLVYLRDSVSSHLRATYEKKLSAGIHIAAEGKAAEADCKSAYIEWKDKNQYHTKEGEIPSEVCCLTVTEGKFHEVRRMFKALGNEVVYLRRIRIQRLKLDENLAEGQYRPLSKEELGLLDAEKKSND